MMPQGTRTLTAEVTREGTPDARWKQLTRCANAALAEGDHAAARAHYREAVREAEALFDAAVAGSGWTDAAPILSLAHANLAKLLASRGEQIAGRNCCQSGLERLLAVVSDGSGTCEIEFRNACFRQLSPALRDFIGYQQPIVGKGRERGGRIVRRVQIAAANFASESCRRH
ncbi:MAG: hypothetical protein AAGA68_11850 [Pseudomonadota bacterium]